MKVLKRHKTTYAYAMYKGIRSLIDSEGNSTFEEEPIYYEPIYAEAHVSIATGNVDSSEFGNILDYDKVIMTDDMNCPINEQSILFIDTVPVPNNANPLNDDGSYQLSYDYEVKRVAKSFNSISIYIKKLIKEKSATIIPNEQENSNRFK